MFNVNFELFDAGYIAVGILSGLCILFPYILKLKKEIRRIKRQYEKKSIGADDSNLKIKTLENKIKTLEVALKKQIEKN